LITKRSGASDRDAAEAPLDPTEYEPITLGSEQFSGTFELDPDVIYEQLDGRLVLVHLRTNRIYELSSTASRFCELLIAGGDPIACLEVLDEEFNTDRETLCAEAQRLLETLSQQEIVRRSP
jgi:hypothetical protein